MKKVKLHDKHFKLFIDYEIIISKIEDLVKVLNVNYAHKKPIFLCVLNGSFLFASELIKRFNHECEVSFVKLASYEGLNSTGNIKNLIGLNDNLNGRNIVIVEDIVDTGLTMNTMVVKLKAKKAKTIRICSLLFKEVAFKGDYKPDFIGFTIPDFFVVGYGMDYNQKGRNLQEIYKLKN